MQVVLLERIEKLGQMGDVVAVKDGYARNYLVPQGKALRATKTNLSDFERRRVQLEAANLRRKEEAQKLAGQIDGRAVVIVRQAGEAGQLYGSVNPRDIAVAFTAQAHHGISNWDLNKDIRVTGRLTQIELINPHAWLHLEVRGADGKVASWKCEMRSANSLRRSGWTREMFEVGSTITVTGSPERRKPNQCYLGTILFADGRSMDRYGQRQLAVARAAFALAHPHAEAAIFERGFHPVLVGLVVADENRHAPRKRRLANGLSWDSG